MTNFESWFDKNKPTIFMVGGIVSMVAGTVMSCWATIKAEKIINETNAKVADLREQQKHAETQEELISLRKHERKIILKAICKVSGYYSIGAGLTGLGIAGICYAHTEQNNRIAVGASAYAALSALVARYQELLKEKGLEVEDENMRLGVTEEREHERKSIDPATGEITTVKETIKIANPDFMGSPYAFYFDPESSWAFVETKGLAPDLALEMSMRILKAKEAYLNDMLRAKNCGKRRVPLFLSDVWNTLEMKEDGIPRYDENGNIYEYDNDVLRACGWVYDPDNPDISNAIDLRIRTVYVQDENGGLKRKIIMDPNVDGNVLGYEYVKRS